MAQIKYFLQYRDRLNEGSNWKDHPECLKDGYPDVSELLRDMFNANIVTINKEFRIVKVIFIPKVEEVK